MKKFLFILLIFLLNGCIFGPPPAPTPDMSALATQMWVQIAVEQTLQALQATATPEPTPTLEPTPTMAWISTPLPAPADLANYTPAFNPVTGMELVYVPAGEFLMGSADTDTNRDIYSEEPQHKVYLDAYWISKTQVTNAMFNECVSSGICKYSVSKTTNPNYLDPLFNNHPVVYISWSMAQTYCTWTGGRLPTEAEWEKAARGPEGQRFPWGSELARIKFANAGDEIGNTTPVGSFPYGKSFYGALDMGGNVREWVSDWYAPEYFKISPQINPQGPEEGEKKVLKGACYQDPWRYSRAANRLSHEPESPGAVRGFRCAYP
ncbi:MAG: formylglycine-generating enzyme family protein [Chloroflexi bacterium]|nr:formylglycine-generating enzyme family protein [Chloroflexota bacterium]